MEWSHLEITGPGQRSPLRHFGEREVPVLHWHGDTFELPEGAVLLASTATYPHQAFRSAGMPWRCNSIRK